MRLLAIFVLLLIATTSARTPMIGNHITVYMLESKYTGYVESCDLGFLFLNCTEFHDPDEDNVARDGFYAPHGFPVCLGIGQIVSIRWEDA